MDFILINRLINEKKYKRALTLLLGEVKNEKINIRLYFLLGTVCFKLNQIENSIYYYKLALQIDSKSINIILNLANSYYVIGNFSEAKKYYLNGIVLNKYDIRPYYGLYLISEKNLSEINISVLHEIIKKSKSLNDTSIAEYLLSKISKFKLNYKSELHHLSNFQNLCFQSRKDFNLQGLFYYNDVIGKHFNKINFVNLQNKKNEFQNIQPIFIIGLPRSGSTLIETCISSSSTKIISLGETSIINSAIIDQIKNVVFKKDLIKENLFLNMDVTVLKDKILDFYSNYFSDEDNIFFIDKSLENFFNIEVILKIFPNAKFINSSRNLKDNTIAIYQSMLPELPWTHSIPDILKYINNYKNITEYFEKKYQDKFLKIDLEDLTENYKDVTKKIFSFCGLQWNEKVLKFYKQKNLLIKTLSSTQLRNRISKYNSNKYDPYKELLLDYKKKYKWLFDV